MSTCHRTTGLGTTGLVTAWMDLTLDVGFKIDVSLFFAGIRVNLWSVGGMAVRTCSVMGCGAEADSECPERN